MAICLRAELDRRSVARDSRSGDKKPRIRQLLEAAAEAAGLLGPVLIQRESGSGEETIALAIHNATNGREYQGIGSESRLRSVFGKMRLSIFSRV
jgi:DNA-binding NtrC family response regulator